MDNDSRIAEIVVYLYKYNSDNHLISVGWYSVFSLTWIQSGNSIIEPPGGFNSMNIRVGGAAGSPKSWLLLYLSSKQKLDSSIYQLGTRVWKSIPIFISLYLSLKIYTCLYTWWQKSRPIPIPELKNCDPSERHLRTRYFLEVDPPGIELPCALNLICIKESN